MMGYGCSLCVIHKENLYSRGISDILRLLRHLWNKRYYCFDLFRTPHKRYHTSLKAGASYGDISKLVMKNMLSHIVKKQLAYLRLTVGCKKHLRLLKSLDGFEVQLDPLLLGVDVVVVRHRGQKFGQAEVGRAVGGVSHHRDRRAFLTLDLA
jgi:hypothetical protein